MTTVFLPIIRFITEVYILSHPHIIRSRNRVGYILKLHNANVWNVIALYSWTILWWSLNFICAIFLAGAYQFITTHEVCNIFVLTFNYWILFLLLAWGKIKKNMYFQYSFFFLSSLNFLRVRKLIKCFTNWKMIYTRRLWSVNFKERYN